MLYMTTSRKLPILLAASTVVLSLFAVAPASAASSVKQKCVSTGTTRGTFFSKDDSASAPWAYNVSVRARVCLSYVMVSKSVRGKTIWQPEVSAASEELTVSHYGYLPEKNGKAATDLLPGGGSSLIHWTALAESLSPRAGGTPGFVFTRDSNYSANFAFLTGNSDAWGALAEPGFSCSKGKCRPVKKSVVLTRTHALSIASDSRVFLYTDLSVNVGKDVMRAKRSFLYWDNGDPCGTEFATACTAAGVKPVTSFKSQRNYGALDHYEAWSQNATFVGIPASLREK